VLTLFGQNGSLERHNQTRKASGRQNMDLLAGEVTDCLLQQRSESRELGLHEIAASGQGCDREARDSEILVSSFNCRCTIYTVFAKRRRCQERYYMTEAPAYLDV
jgi:hypothetical protein